MGVPSKVWMELSSLFFDPMGPTNSRDLNSHGKIMRGYLSLKIATVLVETFLLRFQYEPNNIT